MKTLGMLWMALFTLAALADAPARAADLRAENLRCEYRTNPLGIDVARPRLSWMLASKARGQRQSAYQILVATTEADLKADRGDLWDSGRVASDQSVHVEYAGKPLASNTRCWWKVRAWDRDGSPSAWSPPAFWQMGLLEAGDWKARWISVGAPDSDATLDGASWVWFPEGDPVRSAPVGVRVFRKRIAIPEGRMIARARLLLTADDRWALTVNGQSVKESGTEYEAWKTVADVDVTGRIRTGENVVAIRAENTEAGPAGLIGKLVITFEGGAEPLTIPVDETWKTSNAEPAGWRDADFDDTAWPGAKRIAGLGEGPWGGLSVGGEMGPAPLLRKSFALDPKPIRRATIHATALGLYEIRLNGKHIGDEHLAPGWTDYNKRLAYQTYDVTGALRRGENAFGAILGDGWYCGYVGFGRRRNQYGTHPQLLAQLIVEYADGSRQVVGTDASWRGTSDGPIRHSDLQMGESYDARREMPGWDGPGFDATRWQAAKEDTGPKPGALLVADRTQPVRVTEEIKPIAVREPKPGVFVFDMGQNMVGWVRLKARGNSGETIRLRHAEMLNPDGTIYTTNLRSATQADTYALRGGEVAETWEPHFTFHGFRYVEVTGFTGKPTLAALTGRVAHSDTPRVGRMETSNPLVNQLLKNIDWGQRGNFVSVPTDCPQRDERLGWTGDAQIFIRTATYNRDVAAFFTKWTQDLEDAQSPAGAFPDVAPRQTYVGEGVAAWGDAGVICPWTIYQVYGDKRLLAERYDSMVRWVEYLKKNSNGLLRPAAGYGDWLSIRADTPKDVLATAYFARSTDLVARAAKELGKDEDARKYGQLFEDIKAAFNRAYVAEDGRIKGDTQTDYVFALHFGLLPEGKRALAARYLVENIKDRKGHLSTGFVGVGSLCPALTETGHVDVAYQLLQNDTFPSWGYSIRHGATTIWERWDGWTEEKGFQDPGMNSFNHYSLGSVGEWLFASVAGIDTAPDGPGYKRILVRPHVAQNGLTHARAEYDSLHGRITTDWKRAGGAFTLNVTIPANTTAMVYVPTKDAGSVREGGKAAGEAEGVTGKGYADGCAVYEVGSGTYSFRSIL